MLPSWVSRLAGNVGKRYVVMCCPTGISSATYLTDCFATLLSTAASVLLRIPFFVYGVF